MRLLIGIAISLLALPAYGQAPQLAMPVECAMGTDCVVQNFVDHDPAEGGEAYTDFMCERLSYDGHKGTDIRAVNRAIMLRDIPVLAVADAKVIGTRDGMEDDAPFPQGKECGNGLMLDHGNGWQTQYCHLRSGSVTKTTGDQVKTGDQLGLMGMSGNTEFPHLHITVRHNGNVIDPYVGYADYQCGQGELKPLWTAEAADSLAYRRSGLLGAGFSGVEPSMETVENGKHRQESLPADAELMVFWAQIFGAHKTDVLHVALAGPDGQLLAEHNQFFDHSRAQQFNYIGKKRPAGGWPEGEYTGVVQLLAPVGNNTSDVDVIFEERRTLTVVEADGIDATPIALETARPVIEAKPQPKGSPIAKWLGILAAIGIGFIILFKMFR